jgi:hypothetical protein
MGKGIFVEFLCGQIKPLGGLGLLIAAILTSIAWAGSYSVEYSGGRAKIESIDYGPDPDVPLPTWYKPYGDQVGGKWGVLASPKDCEGGMGPVTLGGKASCGEEITATFQWSGPGDPPSSVVVKEECVATFSGPSGARDTTLPVIGYTTTPETSEIGVRWTVRNNPGQSFTVTCTPTSYVEAPYPTRTGTSISYKATAYPAEIVLTGGIGTNSAKKYLVGQQLHAELVCPETPVLYQWSVDGGEPFAEFAITASSGHRVGVASAMYLNEEFTACFAKRADPATISLTARFGSMNHGQDLTITKQFAVVTPAFTVLEVAQTSQIQLNGGKTGWGYEGTFDRGDNQLMAFGVRAKLTIPQDFLDNQATGYWNWAQTLDLNYTRIRNGATERVYANDEGEPFVGHDGDYSYDTVYPLYDTNLLGTEDDHWVAADFSRGFGDSCHDTFDGVEGLTSHHPIYSFRNHAMFVPSGGGSQHVSLWGADWGFAGVFTKESGVWTGPSSPNSSITVRTDPGFPDWVRIVNPIAWVWKLVQ